MPSEGWVTGADPVSGHFFLGPVLRVQVEMLAAPPPYVQGTLLETVSRFHTGSAPTRFPPHTPCSSDENFLFHILEEFCPPAFSI